MALVRILVSQQWSTFYLQQVKLTSIDVPGLLSSTTQNSTAGGAPTSTSPSPQIFSPFSGFNSASSASQSNTPQPSFMSGFAPPKASTIANDPFAGLASPQFGSKPSTPKPATPAPVPAATNDDDEWSFSSALPTETPSLPIEHSAVVKEGQLRIDMKAIRPPQAAHAVALSFAFSNTTTQPISELHFELAVTKVSLRVSHGD